MNLQIKIIISAIAFLISCNALTAVAQEYKKETTELRHQYIILDIIDYDIPNKLSPGQDYTVTITMVNNGNSKWTRGENFFLKLYSEVDNQYQSDDGESVPWKFLTIFIRQTK